MICCGVANKLGLNAMENALDKYVEKSCRKGYKIKCDDFHSLTHSGGTWVYASILQAQMLYRVRLASSTWYNYQVLVKFDLVNA